MANQPLIRWPNRPRKLPNSAK